MNIEFVEGGICAPQGFSAAAVHCGFRDDVAKDDLALIVSDELCSAAAVYTTNKVKGAPVAVNKKHLADGHGEGVLRQFRRRSQRMRDQSGKKIWK